ncbi:hypothetical protein C8F01DRAFT_1138613 [Mycena amicta]|nr:hypothetical protein C8F01DRAFT_1138613 [Mycena amicta]
MIQGVGQATPTSASHRMHCALLPPIFLETHPPYQPPMAISGPSNPSLACGDIAGTRARQQLHACRQPHGFFVGASQSPSSANKTQSSVVHFESWEDDNYESMIVVEKDERDMIRGASDLDWKRSTLMRPDACRQATMDLELISNTLLPRSWSSTPRSSLTPSPATSVLSLGSTTSTSTSSSSSLSSSSHSTIPIPFHGARSTPACVPMTAKWAHLPPPPGYVPNPAQKTAYNDQERLAHLEADEFCSNIRTTAVYCMRLFFVV